MSFIQVASPVVAFVLVIGAPILFALWAVFKTLNEKSQAPDER